MDRHDGRIDIVITTYNRREILDRAVRYVIGRTRSPYRIIVVDDGSTDRTPEYLEGMQRQGAIDVAIRNGENCGPHWALHAGFLRTTSDPLVCMGDDILVPDLEGPDWLARLRAAMLDHPQVGILDLNNPSANLKRDSRVRLKTIRGGIQVCRFVGGACVMVRREIMEKQGAIREWRDDRGQARGPWRKRCLDATADRWQIGYLRDVYCQHLGRESIRRPGVVLSLVDDVDPATLEPRDARWRI